MRNNRVDYGDRAEHCLRMAEKCSYREARVHWLQLAAAWRALSDHDPEVESQGQRRSSN